MRQLTAVLLAVAFIGLAAGLSQPAAARPQAVVNPPMQLVINEVAWGGTRANTYHEWIELYNPGPGDLNLTNWKLNLMDAAAGSLIASIDLAPNSLPGNVLPAGSYFLMERYEAATSVASDLDYADSVALSKTGMRLILIDNNGVTQDTANSNGGNWPAGSMQPDFCSMERVPDQPDSDPIWHNNNNVVRNGTDASGNPLCGTPHSANSTKPFTATPSVTATGTETPTPTATPANYPRVIINEIAWMGTRYYYQDEWIELYNPSGVAVNLNGWTLRSKYGPLQINLKGKIGAKGYFLLEHNSDNVVSDIPADQVYVISSLLSDYGEALELRSPDGEVVDTANKQNGYWPAGNYYLYCSMERGGPNLPDVVTSWLTNIGLVTNGLDFGNNRICGTPRHPNWAWSVTPTASLTPTPITPTRTPYPPYYTRTPTRTPKKSPTPTRNPFGPTPAYVIINEFLPQPRSDWNGDGVVNTGDEFIEIINLGTKSVLLSNWKLDDQEGDSNPYVIDNVYIQPKARLVFFSSETGILLSNGGDSVRLFTSAGKISDAYTYGVVRNPDQTWCRLPDGGPNWVFGCTPTIQQANRMAQSVIVGNRVESAICLSKKLPLGVQLAECDAPGLSIWSPQLWEDRNPYPLYLYPGEDIYILD